MTVDEALCELSAMKHEFEERRYAVTSDREFRRKLDSSQEYDSLTCMIDVVDRAIAVVCQITLPAPSERSEP